MSQEKSLRTRLTKLSCILPVRRRRAILLVALLAACPSLGYAQFRELVNQVPRSANAIVILNMEKAKKSPMGLREDWTGKVEKAFEDGIVRVPSQATHFVLAAQIDFEFLQPIWEAALFDLDQEISMEQIAQSRHGMPDTIEKLPAVRLPNDTYLVQLGPHTLGAMGPGNRQVVSRWIREVRGSSPPSLSPYLKKAAVYSDKAGTEIIMAIDLEGALSSGRVAKYLKSKQKLLDEWQADRRDLTGLLSGVQGIRVGVRLGEYPSARIVVDTSGDASLASNYAKPLMLQILADKGAKIDDLQSWTGKAEGKEIWLGGKLTNDGLRRLLSVVDSPVAEDVAEKPPKVSPGDELEIKTKASLAHYREIVRMFNDLKHDMNNAPSLASTSFYFDKYARRIEKLPILDVDEDLLKYSAFVARSLRKAANFVRVSGIRSGVGQAQITTASGGSYDSGGYRYGAYGMYAVDPMAESRDISAQRRVVRAEEQGEMAMNVYEIRDAIITATAEIRRSMTQKYKVEF
jgi:hypothetical protein